VHKRILAIGHDAYRAGAQIAFLHILRWLRDNHDAEISLLLGSGGDLVDDYSSVLPTSILEAPPSKSSELRQRWRRSRQWRGLSQPGRFDLIYANSSASAALAADLSARVGCPALCHVHELNVAMRRFGGRFDSTSGQFAGFIAVSRAVEDNLTVNHGIDRNRIHLIHEAVPLPEKSHPVDRSQLRAELGIAPDAFIVGGCGTLDWRKGPDVFLLVARSIAERRAAQPIHLLWLGGYTGDLDMMHHDIERLGVADMVTVLDHRSDTRSYFELFDTFLLTSREDPFPLVCLEAATLGIPIVCFADAGGMPEFVEDDAGYVVPYLDIEGAADRLRHLVTSPATVTAMGRRAAQKAAERCGIDVIGPQIGAVLDRHLVGSVAPSTDVTSASKWADV
jgi:glycosyltransferase involved in cell wall biosynthesis